MRTRLGDDRYPAPGEPSTLIGAQIGGFTLARRLGNGRLGPLYLAQHSVLATRRAVRVLAPRLTQDLRWLRRFLDETRAAARLSHPNLVEIHDVGQLPGGAWFVALDYLGGGTLAQRIAHQLGPSPPSEVAHLVAELAAGLQLAHDHGLVHRDLRPEHGRLSSSGRDLQRVVLVELGIAAGEPGEIAGGGDVAADGSRPGAAVSAAASLTARGYLAPEQLRGAPPTPASNVFALGVIAYQLATGGWFPHQFGDSRTGYSDLSPAELLDRHASGPPVDPRDRIPGLPAVWAEAILAALAVDPAHRPASPRALARALAEAVASAAERPERSEAGVRPEGPREARPDARSDLRSGARTDELWPRPWAAERSDISRQAAPPPSAADIGSRYQLGDKLGGGGMAEVFSATMLGAEGFSRRVAIKRVQAGLSQIPAFAAMFVAEAQIASRLSHPNIVSVLDFARDAEGRLYLVMEYVDGHDLASLLASGPIEPGPAIYVLVELLRGLGYAHEIPDAPAGAARGVVHRDVSPQNVLLSRAGAVLLSDFGLAKVRAASGVVRSDVVRGKPSYMSPEQVAGEPLDGRSDLYAAGVMLWEMLADRPLFSGTAREITAQVMFKAIPRPSSVRSDVPADLEAVAMTLLAHDRADRYPTAAAAIEALLACRDAPRDGRGALTALLAARFIAVGSGPHPAAGAPRIPRAVTTASGPISAPAVPASAPRSSSAVRGRRGPNAATLGIAAFGGIVFGGIALVLVLLLGPVARSQTAERAALPAIEPSRDAGLPEAGDAGDASDAGEPSAARTAIAAAPPPAAQLRNAEPGAPRTAPRRERMARRAEVAGELAIIVRPWAMIWLNGKPVGQTPFRAPIAAGRYRVRLANDDAGRDETVVVTVEPERTATIERSW